MKKCIAVLLISLLASVAFAAPTVTLTADKSEAASGESITLTWSSTGAAACAADWTTSTATSGTQVVTVSATRAYDMTCTASTGTVTLSWTAPTTYTDGTALGSALTRYDIWRAGTEDALTGAVTTSGAIASGVTWTGNAVVPATTATYTLAPSANTCWGIQAVVGTGTSSVWSAMSGVVCQPVVADSATATLHATLTVRIASAPTGLSVQ